MDEQEQQLHDRFERSIWQRTEVLKLIEKLSEEQFRSGSIRSVYSQMFLLVKMEWELLERIEGREPTIINDDDLDGDPAAEIPAHALTIVWLRSRDGCVSLWRQNEARKADLLMRFEELDLDKKFTFEAPNLTPQPWEQALKEVSMSVGNVIWTMMQPLASILGLREALCELGFRNELQRIYSQPHEAMPPWPSFEIRPYRPEGDA